MVNSINIKNKRFSKMKITIIVCSIAIILAAGFFFYKLRQPTASKTSQNSLLTMSKSTQDKYIEADTAAYRGGYDKGQKVLDDALNSKTSNIDRSYVYIQKSTLAFNNSQMADAIKFALKAEELYPSRQTADVLAQTYEQSGDKVLALKYYKLVVQRTTDQEKNLLPTDYQYYKSKVEELSK